MLRNKRHGQSLDKKRPVDANGLARFMISYLEWAKVIEHASPDTLRRRDSALRRFIAWCDERSLTHPSMITLPILERYQRYLFYYRKADGNTLSLSSQQVILSPLKAFFKWLTRERHITSNPASELQLPKRAKQLPKVVLHRDEVERLLNQPDLASPSGLRDRAIMEVMYATGMRRMELCNLKLHHLDRYRSAVLIHQGKGSKDRFIPLGARALAWINYYLEDAYPQLLGFDRETLFLTDYGERFNRDSLSNRVKKYFNAAHINKPGSCHLLRHACATHMLENGADIRFIQALLGHSDLTSTQIYTHVNIDQLAQIHAATHPAQLPDDLRLAKLASLAAKPGTTD